LVLQTWFGEAGAHLAAGRLAEAARCYDEAARFAQQSANLILAIEAFRMGGFCHARLGKREEALSRGDAALKIGKRLKPEARGMTTLPIAAMDLLGVIEPISAEAIREVKLGRDASEAEIRAATEVRAAKMERTGDSGSLAAIEKGLTRDLLNSCQHAQSEVNAIVHLSGPEFRQAFAETCTLLGRDWPLTTAAIPRVPPTEEARQPKEVLAA
jgi:tetratricopeptide (TPR) repeat protein